jgi:hypothetical protein
MSTGAFDFTALFVGLFGLRVNQPVFVHKSIGQLIYEQTSTNRGG